MTCVPSRHILTQALQYREQHTNRTHQIIEQAKQYIETGLASQELSLYTVVRQWVESQPLQYSFQPQTGVTFVAFDRVALTRQCIYCARPRYRPAIAYQVGYQPAISTPCSRGRPDNRPASTGAGRQQRIVSLV
jgi:hypothetical protein